ncbi:hypothetical protein [Mitsuaria sp. 7]|uniref:hypothetical protein n=1 Tax=Mitsuaria sp. 7 TaxID=1658665 RepID=UPI0007DDAC61|nr:hypothetical protein [Mitsuaria sp. 7]ANH68958.1 hypothetical protein ABE85_17740 [Mitsuaria sp. 7]
MTTFEFKLELSDRFARDALAAGFLNAKAVRALIKDAMARRAAQELLDGAARGQVAMSKPMSMKAIQAEVNAVRRERDSKGAIGK